MAESNSPLDADATAIADNCAVDPQIQFVTTADDVRIAYWTLGSGPPLIVAAPLAASHVSIEWRIPALAAWYQHLAAVRTVVRWDFRASGLSDRDVSISDGTVEADLDAVLNALDISSADAIVPTGGQNESIIAYAAHHADTFQKMVLLSPMLRGRETQSGQSRSILALL